MLFFTAQMKSAEIEATLQALAHVQDWENLHKFRMTQQLCIRAGSSGRHKAVSEPIKDDGTRVCWLEAACWSGGLRQTVGGGRKAKVVI